MRTDLDFENLETKKLLTKLKFEFFLKQHISVEQYRVVDIEIIYESYKATMQKLREQGKFDHNQFLYFMEGKVRKMFIGGFLPTLFELDKSSSHHFLDFPGIGENWAYFDYWQKRYKRKLRLKNSWEVIVRTGSILAITLSIIKILEYINQHYR